jgi:catechol 2,3-dioxygenase-like lactoylglutathione lyase family enzyme
MFTNISIMTIWVSDQDAARDFYVDKLGFEVGDDVRLGDYRWITIHHPNQPELHVNLAVVGPPLDAELQDAIRRALAKGSMPGFGLNTDDCRTTYEELSAKGVEFLQPPSERPYGVEALARDNSGNWLVIVEPHEFNGDTDS